MSSRYLSLLPFSTPAVISQSMEPGCHEGHDLMDMDVCGYSALSSDPCLAAIPECNLQDPLAADFDVAFTAESSTKGQSQERSSCNWPGCTVMFSRAGDLRRHIRSKHIPFQMIDCNECGKSFSRTDKLRDHIKRKHASLESSKIDISTATTRAKTDPAISSTLDFFDQSIEISDDFFLGNVFLPGENELLQQDIMAFDSPLDTSFIASDNASDNASYTNSLSTRSLISIKAASSKDSDTVCSSTSERDDRSQKRFACPFSKHDPQTYNIIKHRTCAASGWSSVARLK